ncbi:MAG: T9SS type A sorting domain-containing protein [Ignavibacteria bacterium]|nr:T9SS type A sorting domain-containing protein [Ignavibacteria bacterium]
MLNPPTNLPNGGNITYSFAAALGDDNSSYIANLKKSYKIDQNHLTEFDGTQTNQSTVYIVEQNSGQILAPSTKTINGRVYNFAAWTDGNGSNPRSITPSNNLTYTAIYKVINKSNNQNAYLSNSQRKVVRTNNGHLHKVYESMGRVWYERSTNNGSTWFIMNGGRPLDNGQGRLPSIDSRLDAVGIVWQEAGGGALKIQVAYFYNGIMDNDYPQNVFWDIDQPYTNNSNPVIGWEYNSRILIAWENKTNSIHPIGIVCKYGSFSSSGVNWFDTEVISGTDINSTNPTIAPNKISNLQGILHLAWQQNPYSVVKSIKYCKLTADGFSGELTLTDTVDVSSGSGYQLNYDPSITLNSGNYPTVAWVGSPYLGSSMRRVVNRSKSSSGWSSSFNLYDDYVDSPSINYSSDGNTVIAWSYAQGSANKFLRSGLIKTFGTTGQHIQLANAPNLNSMYAISFRNQTIPYSFLTTPSVGSIAKINTIQMTSGREAIITKDNSQFYFIIGDITLNDNPVEFIYLDEDLSISNLEELNNCLISEPINLNDLSNLAFSIQYGVSDSINAASQLQGDKFIEYKLELIDEANGNILGSYYYFRFDSTTTQFNQDASYTMDLTGIDNMTVRFRLRTETNMGGGYTIGNIFDEENTLPKNNFISLSFGTIKEYDLAQNYPNPFNPSTRISYQIPEDGIVTMKIYDILGKEVNTLVNEQKAIGRYEVKFDASELASGVYIYRLQVNNFVSSKKLMLLK